MQKARTSINYECSTNSTVALSRVLSAASSRVDRPSIDGSSLHIPTQVSSGQRASAIDEGALAFGSKQLQLCHSPAKTSVPAKLVNGKPSHERSNLSLLGEVDIGLKCKGCHA